MVFIEFLFVLVLILVQLQLLYYGLLPIDRVQMSFYLAFVKG